MRAAPRDAPSFETHGARTRERGDRLDAPVRILEPVGELLRSPDRAARSRLHDDVAKPGLLALSRDLVGRVAVAHLEPPAPPSPGQDGTPVCLGNMGEE